MSDITPTLTPYESAVFGYFLGGGPNGPNADQLYTSAQVVSPAGIAPPPDYLLASRYPAVNVGPAQMSGQEVINLFRFYYNGFLNRFPFTTQVPFRYKWPIIVEAALLAKTQLQGDIGPLSAGSIIPQEIRPATVYAQGATTPTEDWNVTVSAAGWTTLSSPSFTINLNATTTTSNINLQPQNRVVMLVLGIGDLTSAPKINEYQWYNQQNAPLGIHGLPAATAYGETNIWEFNEAILIQKNTQFKLALNYAAAGVSRPVLFGIQFVTPEYAQSQ
jgi:hypothetical protein